MVGFLVSAAAASALLVCLSPVRDMFWKPGHWLMMVRLPPPGILDLTAFEFPVSGLLEWIQFRLLLLQFSGFLQDCESCSCTWYPNYKWFLNFAFGSRYCWCKHTILWLHLGFLTDDCTQLPCRSSVNPKYILCIRFLLLAGLNCVHVVITAMRLVCQLVSELFSASIGVLHGLMKWSIFKLTVIILRHVVLKK